MIEKLVALILILHPCHCKMKDEDRVEFIQKDAQEPEDKFDPEWLSGALEHKFCERIEPEPLPGTTADDGDAGPEPAGTTEAGEPVPEETAGETDLAASPDAEVSADTAGAGEVSDGAVATPVAPAPKPVVAVKKVVKAA